MPKDRFHSPANAKANASTPSHAKHSRVESGLQLILKTVIGTTTSSADAFDADPENSVFVCCAGPAVILSHVDEHLNISQRLFRAKPNVQPINATQSFYKSSTPPSTPARSRHGSPLKTKGFGIGPTANSEHLLDSPGHGLASSRGREATCVSLSRRGNLLSIGEVMKQSYPTLLSN